jgi:hypothetical protein
MLARHQADSSYRCGKEKRERKEMRTGRKFASMIY